MGTVPYAWSGHDDEGNVVTGSGSITLTSGTQPPALPLVGAAMQTSNTDPGPLEAFAGRSLGLNRTYWNFGTTGSFTVAASLVQAGKDKAAGRVSWLSYKLAPGMSWAQGASGLADAAVLSLGSQLQALDRECWVAIHHEPEGDGVLSDWVAMQQRLLPMLAQAPNVKPWIILTGWDTFLSGNPAFSLDALYPVGSGANLGIDRYNNYGDAQHPVPPGSGWTEMKATYDPTATFAKAHGIDWAIAETGLTDLGGTHDAGWFDRAFDDMANHPVKPGIGLAYFNSSANSVGTWPLGTGIKRTKFAGILNRSR